MTGTGSYVFYGIALPSTGRATVSSNTIGHNSTANSIQNAGTSTTFGIHLAGTGGSVQTETVQGNVVANMRASGTGASVRIRGISYSRATPTTPIIQGNTIHDLATTGTSTGIGAGSQTAFGIYSYPGSSPSVFTTQHINGNTIYAIAAENTGAVSTIATGIASTNLLGEISGNAISDIRNLSTGTTATAPPIGNGIYIRFASGGVLSNNMISLGNGQTSNTQFSGIWTAGADSTNVLGVAYNSVLVGGTATSATLSSFGFLRGNNTGTTVGTKVILRDNALSNVRSGAGGKYYAIGNQSSVAPDTGWPATASNYNVLHAADPLTVGLWGSADQTFAGWQAASTGDANSVAGDPLFVSTTNLHITNLSSPANNAGTPVAGITVDYDNQTRSPGTPDIGADEFGPSTVNINVSIASGWNMISNPVTSPVPDDSAKHLYPTLNTTGQRVFAFLNPSCVPPPNGYQGRDTMGNGVGYWGRFPAAITNPITGTPRTRDSMTVCTGWNMVGSISNTVDTNTIVSVPPGIRAGNWFGYSNGYIVVTQITPGKAYWIKANANGKFVMANPLAGSAKTEAGETTALDNLNTLTVTDSKGGSQVLYFGGDAEQKVPSSLYDMPPVPPIGAFDARFESAEGGSMVKTHAATVTEPVEFVVTVQSDAYPVTVTWTVNKGTASYELTDGQGGKVFRAKDMTGQGSIKITNGEMNRFTVRLVGNGQLPAEYGLSQNYPNPFNPTTNIKYALPVESKVAIHIYNVLGQKVRTLMNDNVAAGYHTAEWNGTGNEGQQLASGVYFLQMSATGTNGKTFSEIRKLMMMK